MKEIINFFFEIAHLTRVPRRGLSVIGIENTWSVAEHSFLAAEIAYVLGKLEKADPQKTALIALFHDNAEARIDDRHLIYKCYFNKEKEERKAFLDQIKRLPGKKDIISFFEEFNQGNSKEGIVAKDAEILACAIEVKTYLDQGNEEAEIFLKRYKTLLKTKSAKKIFLALEKRNITNWWKEIEELKREIEEIEG